MSTPATSKNIHEAMVKIRQGCPYIKKEGQMNNSGGRYSYAQLEDVIHNTRPLMDAEQVTIHPCEFELLSDSPIGTRRLVVLKVRYQLHHAPSNTSVFVVVPGEGADSADKACNKALAAAEKLAVLQAFYIERGNDDPDKYPSDDPEPPSFTPGKGEPAETEAKAIDAIDTAPDQDRLDKLMEAARKRKWDAAQWERIRAAANLKAEELAAF